jgi:hypothetical protein
MGDTFGLRFWRGAAGISVIAMAAAFLSGCASTGTVAGGGSSAPANYRKAVAVELRQMEDVSTIKSPEISQPYEKFMGLYRGGTRTVVCVKLARPNIIGMIAVYYYLFYFTDGHADGLQQAAISPAFAGLIGCDDQPLTPFTELVRRT